MICGVSVNGDTVFQTQGWVQSPHSALIEMNEIDIKKNFFVEGIPYNEVCPWLLRKHYAHRIPSVSYSFGLYDKDKILQGVCTFGIPPQENCMLCCGEYYKDKTLELNRLVKNDNLPKNTQTYFVAQCFKSLPKPLIVLSYADPNYGHRGYTYQALNFYYTGIGGEGKEYIYQDRQLTARHINKEWFQERKLVWDDNKTVKENWLEIGGQIVDMEPKHRYVLFLGNRKEKKDMLKNFKWRILHYPKGNNTRYDTSERISVQIPLILL